jgi:hypothetical protein
LCTRQESNLHHKLRKLVSYPLNDGCNLFFTANFFGWLIQMGYTVARFIGPLGRERVRARRPGDDAETTGAFFFKIIRRSKKNKSLAKCVNMAKARTGISILL